MLDRVKRSASALWQLCSRLRGKSAPRREASTSLLVLRLENTEILSDHLAKAGMARLVMTIWTRLGGNIRPGDPVQMAAQGLFTVLLEDRSEIDAMRFAERLHQGATAPVPTSGRTVTPVLTGVLLHRPVLGALGIQGMIEEACSRLNQVGTDDLGKITLYVHQEGEAPQPVQASVAEAAVAGQIVAVFQPQISCHTGRVTGFEALARWNHPVRGMLSPAAFMPMMTMADHSALTVTILRQALAALKHWDAAGFDVPQVSLNISDCELTDPGFAASLLWELDRQEIPTNRLVLEVLESVGPVTANAQALSNISRLSKAGCLLDLDDFGTGYASLDAIRQFGVHRIKIDRSFVTGCDIDPGQQRMVLAILALAERLGIAALAEGVETREEHAFLAQIGCDEVQGYAVARPLLLADTLSFLARHSAEHGALPRLGRNRAS